MYKKSKIEALDGLRGMALLLVLISHLSGVGLNVIGGLNMAGIGKYGVYLFFVLSSFLLSVPIIKYSEDYIQNRKAWLNYFVRRFFRIYPLFIVVLIVSFLSTLLIGDYTGGKGLPFTMGGIDVLQHLMLQQGFEVLWSIPVEFKFYFLLPVVIFIYKVILKENIFHCLVFSVFLVALSMYIWPEDEVMKNDIRLGPYLSLFIAGVMTALVHLKLENISYHKKSHQLQIEVVAGVSLLVMVFFIPSVYSYLSDGSIPESFFTNKFYIFSILWSVIIIASIHGAGHIRSMFSNKLLRFVGLVSYSAYLLHIGVIKVINNYFMFNPVLKGWLIVLLTMFFAYISYRLIEKPFSKIRVNY